MTARKVIDRNTLPRMTAMRTSVMPALRLRGSLKAVVPFEMASTPVRAVVPLENAWSNRNGVITARVRGTSNSAGLTTTPSVPVEYRKKETSTVTRIMIRKKKVGIANKVPDSLTPRRLMIMMIGTIATASATR